jgi:hypothetical protein
MYVSDHPLAAFALVLSSLIVILCTSILLALLPRSTVTRPVGKIFTGLFFGSLGLLALDELITVLFHEDNSEHLTELPTHMLILRVLMALGLAGVTIGLNLDSDRWSRRVPGDPLTPAQREEVERLTRLNDDARDDGPL